MRAILVDWIIEVHLKYKLQPETLFLTVNLIDRCLEVTSINRQYL
jgi:G2/mitotic-specific cyclin-B, other